MDQRRITTINNKETKGGNQDIGRTTKDQKTIMKFLEAWTVNEQCLLPKTVTTVAIATDLRHWKSNGLG